MITIIMSVGFSVDYSAHITYGYVISKEADPKNRVRDALGDLGWPVVQGAASTVMAVAVLADVPAYMIVTFFKTVFLAITIGLLHGLVFLPLMLSIFVRGSNSLLFVCMTRAATGISPLFMGRFQKSKNPHRSDGQGYYLTKFQIKR